MDQLSDDELIAVRESLDKQAIYENAVKYCRGADRLDIDLLKDAYWEDGTDDHGGFVGNTHDFCEFAVAGKGLFTSVNHHVSNIQIELLGEKRAGLWKILHRVCLWDWNQYQESRSEWDRFGLTDSPNHGGFAPDDPIYGSWCPS